MGRRKSGALADKVDRVQSRPITSTEFFVVPLGGLASPVRISVIPKKAKVSVETCLMEGGAYTQWPLGPITEETHDIYSIPLYAVRFRMIEGESFIYEVVSRPEYTPLGFARRKLVL